MTGLTVAEGNAIVDAVAARLAYVTLLTDEADTDGSSEGAGVVRQPVQWRPSASTDGQWYPEAHGVPVLFRNCPPGTYWRVGFFTAATGGQFCGSWDVYNSIVVEAGDTVVVYPVVPGSI